MNWQDVPCYWIGRRLRWSGMLVSDQKEKYGTWRVYCSFGWFWNSTLAYKLNLNRYTYPLAYAIQKHWYRYVHKKALEKFPGEARAILCGADWTELLMGLDSRLVREQKNGYTEINWEENRDGDM